MTLFKTNHGVLPSVVFVNLPRTVDHKVMTTFTSVIEEIKDGIIQTNFGNEFYDIFTPIVPHVVVLSNTGPDIGRLSTDRWRLYWIGGEQFKYACQPVTVKPWVNHFDQKTNEIVWTIVLIPHGNRQYKNDVPYIKHSDSESAMRNMLVNKTSNSIKLPSGKIKVSKKIFPHYFRDFYCRSVTIFSTYNQSPQFCRATVQANKNQLIANSKQYHGGMAPDGKKLDKSTLNNKPSVIGNTSDETATENKQLIAEIINE